MNAAFEAALAAHAAGLCVLPPREDGSKAPDARSWTGFQRERPTDRRVKAWYEKDRHGLGLVCGLVSGGLEMLEIEGRGVEEGVHRRIRELAEAAGLGTLLDRIMHGYSERTPSGGLHLLYFVDRPLPNTKLAARPATPVELEQDPANNVRVLIETRGEGGYVIVAPSGGPVHPTGGAWELLTGGFGNIATLTAEERDDVWAVARVLDEMPVVDRPPKTPGHDRPGDRFNAAPEAQAVVLGILEKHGWTVVSANGDLIYLRRPGKTVGISASLGYVGPGVLRVFTTSTVFDARAYDPFGVYAILEHGGDFEAAAAALAQEYGQAGEHGSKSRPADNGAEWEEVPLPPALTELPPALRKDAFIGLVGDVVRETVELFGCDPLSVVAQFLVMWGSLIPSGLREAMLREPGRDYVLVVGPTGIARKGSVFFALRRLFVGAEPGFGDHEVFWLGGSGEGLLTHMARIERGDDEGQPSDRRGLVFADEFGQVLAQAQRVGQTMLSALRSLWNADGGADITTRANAVHVDEIHLAAVLHATPEEVQGGFRNREITTGLVNRLLVARVRPAEARLTSAEYAPAVLMRLTAALTAAIAHARHLDPGTQQRLVTFSPEAIGLWEHQKPRLDRQATDRVAGNVVVRGAAHVARLALMYALLERHERVEASDLRAALAVWDACRQSAVLLFGALTGDPVADHIYAVLVQLGGVATRTDLRDALSRHGRRDDIEHGLVVLQARGLIARRRQKTGGRPVEIIRIVDLLAGDEAGDESDDSDDCSAPQAEPEPDPSPPSPSSQEPSPSARPDSWGAGNADRWVGVSLHDELDEIFHGLGVDD